MANHNFEAICANIATYQTSWAVIANLAEGQRFKIISPTVIKPVAIHFFITCLSKEESGDKVSLLWLKTFIQTTEEAVDQLAAQVWDDEGSFKKARRTTGGLWLALAKAHRMGFPNLRKSFGNCRALEAEKINLKRLIDKTAKIHSPVQLARREKLANSPSLNNVRCYTKQQPVNEMLSKPDGFQACLSKVDRLRCLGIVIYSRSSPVPAVDVLSQLQAMLGKKIAMHVSPFLSQTTLKEITEEVQDCIIKPVPHLQKYIVEITKFPVETLIIQRVRYTLDMERNAQGKMIISIPTDSQQKETSDDSCIKIQLIVRSGGADLSKN